MSDRRKVAFRVGLESGLVLSVGFWGTAPAQGQIIIPISQDRFTDVSVSFPQCGTISDGETGVGFGLFDSALLAEQNCQGPYGHVNATQQSQIDATSVTASGGVFTKSNGGGPDTLIVLGNSFFEVTFELPVASTFALDGTISADVPVDPELALGLDAAITLTGPGEQTIFSHSVSAGTGGIIEETGLLEPGVYTLLAFTSLVIDGNVPEIAVGDASFGFTFVGTNCVRPDPENHLGTTCMSDADCENQAVCIPRENNLLPGDCYVTTHRYLSVAAAAGNGGTPTARRVSVQTVSGDVVLGWMGAPTVTASLDDALVAPLVSAPVFRNWSVDTGSVRLSDCAISSNRTYLIQCTADGATFSEPLALPTTAVWGDVIGLVDTGVASPPQGVANLVDAQQIVKGFQDTNAAPKVWLDLEPVDINHVINLVDAQQAVKGFQDGDFFDLIGALDPCECVGLASCPQ